MADKNLEIIDRLSKFRFKTSGRVRFADVDSFGVVHNIKYLYWLEAARTDYFSNLGVKLTPRTFITDLPLMVVSAKIDYLNACRFNDEYYVHTRVSVIKNSSLTFENIITMNTIPILSATAILVYLNVKENKPQRIGDDIRLLLKEYEGDNIKFLEL